MIGYGGFVFLYGCNLVYCALSYIIIHIMNIQINISLDSKDNINNKNPDQVTFNLDASAIAKSMESKSDLPTQEQLSNLDNIINGMFYEDFKKEEEQRWSDEEIGDLPTMEELIECGRVSEEIIKQEQEEWERNGRKGRRPYIEELVQLNPWLKEKYNV